MKYVKNFTRHQKRRKIQNGRQDGRHYLKNAIARWLFVVEVSKLLSTPWFMGLGNQIKHVTNFSSHQIGTTIQNGRQNGCQDGRQDGRHYLKQAIT